MKKNLKLIITIASILLISLIFGVNQIIKNTVITKRAIVLDNNQTETAPEEIEEIKQIPIPTEKENQYTQLQQQQHQPQQRQPEYISKTEEVYWNIWKSNLFNRFITDINNEGQVPPSFHAHLEFDVTKNREIINCYLGVEPPDFQKPFQTSIIKILKSYQYTNILTFPQKTRRNTKHVRFILRPNFENINPYKTPDDFSKDTEYIETKRLKL